MLRLREWGSYSGGRGSKPPTTKWNKLLKSLCNFWMLYFCSNLFNTVKIFIFYWIVIKDIQNLLINGLTNWVFIVLKDKLKWCNSCTFLYGTLREIFEYFPASGGSGAPPRTPNEADHKFEPRKTFPAYLTGWNTDHNARLVLQPIP